MIGEDEDRIKKISVLNNIGKINQRKSLSIIVGWSLFK